MWALRLFVSGRTCRLQAVSRYHAQKSFPVLHAQGVKKSMPEGSNMWGTLTAETFTPWLEFDFIYLDAWESGVLGKTKVSLA